MNWSHFKKLHYIKQPVPILKPSSKGKWDDFASITPSIWKGDDNKYYMFYTGQGYQSQEWGIGLAISNDLIKWQKKYDRPIIKVTDKCSVSSIDGVALIRNGRYYLFFESKPKGHNKKSIKNKLMPIAIRKGLIAVKWSIKDRLGLSMALNHADGRKIYYLDSEDLLSWDINKARVVFEASENQWDCNGVFSPRVFKFGDKHYLLYGGSNGIKINTGMAISSDLSNWKRIFECPILFHGNSNEWDRNHALMVDIIEIEDGYVGFYEGEDRCNNYRIGMAYSKDLIHWEKYEKNPIIDIGKKGSVNERGVCAPHVIYKNGKHYLFYTAHNRFMQGCCCLAIGEN